ncbi:transcriptional regulator with XRE-family HTH domain [Rhodococcus sp. 27YEA15]|uniref:hypothetical protein n=1 Tax=Rhodococcus sp. 27YEA15 TaxID=3156259 RepID=UPI003C7ABD41
MTDFEDIYHRFEFTFIVELATTSREESVIRDWPARFLDRGGLRLLTVEADGMRAPTTAITVVDGLTDLGIVIDRTHPDLVTRQDIADRVGMTRQAVGQWVRGVRQAATPFPAPYNTVSGGIWFWGDVAVWLARHGYRTGTGERSAMHFPTLDEHIRIDRYIALQRTL